ncbi:LuxR C-terminal-related transcriptional regulator [Paenibacillus guangzhouensis]|uniref:LuxR C-terminal-related transcriptional regulator n=1 Tax=Paenibacillus guangzhouensis TaxID=1473112 RepID=UPI0012675955|nr:LuxR C-terminal-related transcriptional regulator [Paenibacillus guangzhouensis]
MTIPILATKVSIPPLRSNLVVRPRLMERLQEGAQRKLTLISAPAGYGKTTLVSDWLAAHKASAAWLSLDERDQDPARFLTYLIVALQQAVPQLGEGLLGLLRLPQLPRVESLITALVNDLLVIPDPLILVLDDYHMVASESIDEAIMLLLERMPSHIHLMMTTRKDPNLPLARLRVRNQLTEVRASDLRFTASEADEFLSHVMGLVLSADNVALLQSRTEGWAAGLQLAALSMQGHGDHNRISQSFSGSHPFVLDYLVEEVLQQQSDRIQHFLLHTSMLDRLCGTLCDAVLDRDAPEHQTSTLSGQATLEYLERANLFIVPLDQERKWYRYHHLFADILRKRLEQHSSFTAQGAADYHLRASQWYEGQGLTFEAFQHAAAAGDIPLAARLLEGEGMPLIFRGAVMPVLNWLNTLPEEELHAHPSLHVMHASAELLIGQVSGVEPKLQAAEQALQEAELDEQTRDLLGHIASIRATLAVSQHQADAIMTEALRALAYLHPRNLPVRAATTWALGYAYQLQGELAIANKVYTESLMQSRKIGHVMITLMATLGLGMIREAENQLHRAMETYEEVLKLAGDPPLPVACEAHLGMARIYYERNDLAAAKQHGRQCVLLAQQFEQTDRAIAGEVFLASVKFAQGEVNSAAVMLTKADQMAREQNFVQVQPNIAELHVRVLLHQGHNAAAAGRACALPFEHSTSQVRVHLAEGKPQAALNVVETLHEQAQAKGQPDTELKLTVLKAIALHANGDKGDAVRLFEHALVIAEPEGFIRTFVDEGLPIVELLRDTAKHGAMENYARKLLSACEMQEVTTRHGMERTEQLLEPLSTRELEVLQLIAQGLSNHEISERLFIALTTVKGHNRVIFDKLQVKRRTEAVARARLLGLL